MCKCGATLCHWRLSKTCHLTRPSQTAGRPLAVTGPPFTARSSAEEITTNKRLGSLSQQRYAQAATSAASGGDTGTDTGEWGVYNFKATLAYKGTAYKGWQIQNGKSSVPTVQEKVEKAISAIKQENRRVLRIQGAGRTDAGVHARGQVLNFYSHKLTPPVDKLVQGINANLPVDIRVTSIERVAPDFSARYSALSKVYSFSIQTGQIADPFKLGLSQHVYRPLDVDAMRHAAKRLVGRQNFTQFSSIPAVKRPLDPFKTLTRAEVLDVPGGLRILFDGSGFLYNQCRHMVGCLISVGWGQLTAADVTRMLQIGSKEHPGLKYRGWTLAAAEGLCLEEVRYPQKAGLYDQLLYPDFPHDEHGRVWLDAMPTGTEREIIARMKQMS